MTYVSSAAEDPPDPPEEDACRGCGGELCPDCYECLAWSCDCTSVANGIPDERWQEALDDAEDAAVDDAKVRELEGS